MTENRVQPRFATTTEAGVVTVHCAGDLDLATTPRLRDVLLSPFHGSASAVVADLTETTFCDSTVFSVLVESYREALARGIPYAIAAAKTAVARPLAILGLDRVLPLHTGIAEARAAVAGMGAGQVS
ncbi:STAS domain-containing protein [Amycolatopsis mongoliensis]|uniref:Anti-sigma factor antagonist n=1 Tax=Amycolatopsis mongoliensis TaxID=715475 RepID=A0A9Y2JJ85_9PSEU|nr:STAS domain-containing protein [Amycolatopsis sp. 4-36]WIX99524.1 STAS domain-containing protein [Amycolatopsis sp. 4-36]